MTFKEKLAKEYPNKLTSSVECGCRGCPCHYGYEDKRHCSELHGDCTACWNRKMPEEEKKVFTKDDLKDGMIVETREGERYLIIKGNAVRENNWMDFVRHERDLTYNRDHNLDIMKVYANNVLHTFNGMFRNPGDLIWERKATKEITAEEAARLLKEKFPEYGEIKIIV